MYALCLMYALVIIAVQSLRYVKRLYVRKFANNVSLTMKDLLYQQLVQTPTATMEGEHTGTLMTKVISDIDTCVEGMRKFTTEIFDTGVVMVTYLIMLLVYDWKLTLCILVFPPLAYFLANRLRRLVAETAARSKESSGALSGITLDRISNALTYRVYGEEDVQNAQYERYLKDYEQKMILANLWENTMQPIYKIIAMTGTILVVWLGGRNVLGEGWQVWDIAAFSTYLSCFVKMSIKTSHAAHLFNAVQKAQVSWGRIQPRLAVSRPLPAPVPTFPPAALTVRDLSFSYEPGDKPVYQGLSFSANPGDIIGITGPVACGKSTLGLTFLGEKPHGGEIFFGNRPLGNGQTGAEGIVGYCGHDSELFSASLEENIRFGLPGDVTKVIAEVCMDEDCKTFPLGIQTPIGEGGQRLSGGQQARIALARTLFHRRPLMIFDDPFAAVDMATERKIFEHLRQSYRDCIILLISHRLSLFSELDQVIWLNPDGMAVTADHKTLYETNDDYRRLYRMQQAQRGDRHD
ncbi:ABC transporter ATP-binding protein [Megasphaera massiliensis]|uniref:ABC transporter ATP-binding protein n=1 Tax=Megasphaera massiliensis TaxID=1232428 RepID=UPI003AF03BBF